MGAALGFLAGAALQAAGGYAAQKREKKQQSEQDFHQFMLENAPHMPSSAWESPQGQKLAKDLFGEHADAASQMLKAAAVSREQTEQRLAAGPPSGQTGGGTRMTGGGPAMFNMPQQVMGSIGNRPLPPMQVQGPGAAAVEGASAPAAPEDELQQWQAHYEDAKAALKWWQDQASSPGLTEAQQNHIKFAMESTQKDLEFAQRQVEQLGKERRAPAEKAAEVAAERPEKVKTAVETAKGEEPIKIGTAAGEAAARTAVELSHGVTSAKATQAADIEKKKLEALGTKDMLDLQTRIANAKESGKPWTAKDAAAARNTVSSTVARELTPPSAVGKLFTGASQEEKQKETSRRLLKIGLLPDGQRMSDVGSRAILKDGVPVAYILNGKRIEL